MLICGNDLLFVLDGIIYNTNYNIHGDDDYDEHFNNEDYNTTTPLDDPAVINVDIAPGQAFFTSSSNLLTVDTDVIAMAHQTDGEYYINI